MAKITFQDLKDQHPNIKQLGNKVLYTSYGDVVGYDILNYVDYIPNEIDDASKVYTAIKPEWRTLDDAYNFMYGQPTAPDFSKALNI